MPKSLLERAALWFLIILILLAVILGALANWSKLLINEVVVEGAQIIKSDEVIEITNRALAGQVLPLIPRRHLWWYPADKLATQLLSQLPRLATVKTFAEWPGRLSVVVTEREPALLYCAFNCAFIDHTGRAFAPAPTFSAGVFLTWEASSTLPNLPFNLAPAATINRLLASQKIFNKVLDLLKLNQFKINRLERTVDDDFIFWVDRLGTNTGTSTSASTWRILINNDTAPSNLGENLHTALSAIIGESKDQTLPALDYVDLRFGQKVFYKL